MTQKEHENMSKNDSIVTLTEHDTSWSGESDEQPQAASTGPSSVDRGPSSAQTTDDGRQTTPAEQEEEQEEEEPTTDD
jgi:hypothetical protein